MSDDCSNDPNEEIRRMFVDLSQTPRILAGQKPADVRYFLSNTEHSRLGY